MPLEFIALCMLRVLSRKGHEGKLDAAGQSLPSRVMLPLFASLRDFIVPACSCFLRHQEVLMEMLCFLGAFTLAPSSPLRM